MPRAVSSPPLATAADLLRLPDDPRFEVVCGALVEKQAARFENSRSQRQIGERLGPFDRRPGGREPGGWWLGTEVEIHYETHEIYCHDLAGWRRERVPECPKGRLIPIHPDWACEILSPSNWSRDTVDKFQTLQRVAVPHYWVVDLDHEQITVYRHNGRVYEVAALGRPGDRARLEPFEATEVDVGFLLGQEPLDAPVG